MAHVAIMGAGIGGIPAAYELRKLLPSEHKITVIDGHDRFRFVPSNPWVAVGWRDSNQVTEPLAKPLLKNDIEQITQWVTGVDPKTNTISLENGESLTYDYLIITTGPKLAFDEIPGLGPENGFTHSICTLEHSLTTWEDYQKFVKKPGPIVVGAVQGASCFGPAYEFAMILDADLRKRKIRDKVPMTFVTSEPYIGHLGLGGVGDSKGLLESELRQRHIQWVTNAKVDKVEEGKVFATEHDADGNPGKQHELENSFCMLLPAFKGVDPVAANKEMCNPRGFVLIDEHQRNPTFQNIFSAGVCVAIPPVEATPVATGAPKTGYMIESMVTAICENIAAEIAGEPATARATWNALCLADLGDTGVVFVALPQIPPRNVTWAKKGKWVHLAKVAFEKYFLRKVRTGSTDPLVERYLLKTLGIKRTS